MRAAPFIAVVFSGGMLLAANVLFRYERKRGVRFAEAARSRLDRALLSTVLMARSRYHHLTERTIRQSLHYIFHQLLTRMLRSIQSVETGVYAIVRRNKDRANRRKDTVS